jgi:glyoxylase I family protein
MALNLRGTVTLIEVFNVKTSIAFYRDVLGFAVIQSAGTGDYLGWAWLRNGDVELMLNSMYDPGEEPVTPDARRAAAHRDTALFIGCPDVDGAYAHLLSKIAGLKPPVNAHYGMRQLSFSDPDGYGLCLQWPVNSAAV